MNQLFASGGQSIGTSASVSVLPMNVQGWFPLESTGLISLLFRSLLQHHSLKASILWHSAFFMVQLSHPYKWSEVAKSCLTLCDPMDYSLTDFSIHGIFQGRVPEWLAISFSIKKAECQRIDAFELWCWRIFLKVPWTARKSNQSILKKISPEFSLQRLMLKAETQILWPPDVKNLLVGKDHDAGKVWRQEEKGTAEDEMVGWHHQLNRHEFE